jgi:hypothetical protein
MRPTVVCLKKPSHVKSSEGEDAQLLDASDGRLLEEVLQLVVGVVDEQLLEAVMDEDFGAEDVEEPDRQWRGQGW